MALIRVEHDLFANRILRSAGAREAHGMHGRSYRRHKTLPNADEPGDRRGLLIQSLGDAQKNDDRNAVSRH